MAQKRIIEARVRQKVDTLENWMANPLRLLEGEQAFVRNADGREVNYKLGDGTKTFAELEFMIKYDQGTYTRVTGTVLPSPTGQARYSIIRSGIFSQHQGGALIIPAGFMGIISDNGTTWYIDSLVDVRGIKGDKGEGIQLSGSVDQYSDLVSISPVPSLGDSWLVNSTGLLYVYGENGFPSENEGLEFINKSVYSRTDW